jgi:arylsulfatase A-like enzyme
MAKPNILMITCHDIGQHLGCYGVDAVHTESIDALAQNGVRFENMYATSAVCSPARGSLHTGRYPQSNGLMGLLHPPWWWRLNEGERHTADLLSAHGYETYLVGFNHVSTEPASLGYRHVLASSRRAEDIVAETAGLIERASTGDLGSTPFFAKVGFTQVHRPFRNGVDESKGVFVPGYLHDSRQVRDDLAQFQATIAYFDQCVGKIVSAIQNTPIASDTLIVLTSDHGIPYPGAKWTVRKAGIEVPFIAYQPNSAFSGGRTIRALASNVDVLPTLLDYVGADIPANVQGTSFLDVVRGKSETHRSMAFSQYTPDMKRDNLSRSVITDRYHLIRYFDQGRTVAYPVDVHPQEFANHERRCPTTDARPFAQLFDIRRDPFELTDLAQGSEYRRIVTELTGSLLRWMEDVNDPILAGPPRTPYYDRAMDALHQEAAGPA